MCVGGFVVVVVVVAAGGARRHPAVVAVGRQTGACGSVELPFIPRGGDDGSYDVSFSLDFKMSALCTHGGVCK